MPLRPPRPVRRQLNRLRALELRTVADYGRFADADDMRALVEVLSRVRRKAGANASPLPSLLMQPCSKTPLSD